MKLGGRKGLLGRRKAGKFLMSADKPVSVGDRLAAIEAELRKASDAGTRDRIGRRAGVLLQFLEPRDPAGARFARVGRDHDGGYVMVENLLPGGVAYSLGISDDVSWDLAMAERGYRVFQYDHTIDELPQVHPNFAFHKIGICGYGADQGPYRSLDTLLAQNGHSGDDGIILKIDIEGAEWDVFSTILDATLLRFSQIVVEFHWFDQADDDRYFGDAYCALKRLRTHFVPVHVHANNHGQYAWYGDVAVPQILEVTYVRNGLFEEVACSRSFPTALDQPNRAGWPEIVLGSFKVKDLVPPKGVTRDEIDRAYRLMFGRAPEGEAAYSSHGSQPDYDALLYTLSQTIEYRNRMASGQPLGFPSRAKR